MKEKTTKNGLLSGERLAQCRNKKGMTQKELGKMVYVTGQHISNVERGVKPMSLELARALSKLFGVREEYLLGEDDSPTESEKDWALRSSQHERNSLFEAFEQLGYLFAPFEKAKTLNGSEVPKRIMIYGNKYSDYPEKEFVCEAEDFNYLSASILNLIKAQMNFFLESKCHEMTDEEKQEEQELRLQEYADKHGVSRASVSVTESGVYLINGKIPVGFHAVFKGQEEDFKKYSSKSEESAEDE